MSLITSHQNQRVKNAIKLRNHRDRIRQKRFLIDGARELEHALAGGIHVAEVFCCPDLVDAQALSLITEHLNSETTMLQVNQSVWEKLAYGQRRDGILAVANIRPRDLSSIEPSPRSLIVVLDAIEKPGNVGAVIRTADAAGATAVIVTDFGGDLFNPNIVRASLGTLFRLPVVACTATDAIEWLQQHKIAVHVAVVGSATSYTQVDLRSSVALVFGSESHGVSAVWHADGLQQITLPMHGFADSLNVSATAAIVLYEAVRQRAESNRSRKGEA